MFGQPLPDKCGSELCGENIFHLELFVAVKNRVAAVQQGEEDGDSILPYL